MGENRANTKVPPLSTNYVCESVRTHKGLLKSLKINLKGTISMLSFTLESKFEESAMYGEFATLLSVLGTVEMTEYECDERVRFNDWTGEEYTIKDETFTYTVTPKPGFEAQCEALVTIINEMYC